MIDGRVFGNTPEQIQAVALSLQGLALRVRMLVDARDYPQAELLTRRFSDDIREWRAVIQELLMLWITDPTARLSDDLRDKLAAKLARVEARVEDTLGQLEQGALTNEDYANFYRLLGSYRGLSEVMVTHAGSAERIHWERLWEPRF
jgi:hypothetical protein